MMENETDEALLLFMAFKDSNEDRFNANRAAEAFWRRHSEHLKKICAGIVPPHEVEDLLQETFLKVYEKAGTFNAGEVENSNQLRARVRAWLGKIAKNLNHEWYRTDKINKDAQPLPENNTIPTMESTNEKSENENRILQAFENCLNDRERDVLRVYYDYNDPNTKNNRLPNQVMSELAGRWDTTSENIRQIKHRAEKKIQNYLNRNKNNE